MNRIWTIAGVIGILGLSSCNRETNDNSTKKEEAASRP